MADEYIKREDAQDKLEAAIADDWEMDYAIDRLNEIPAADVRPVVRGQWIDVPYSRYFKCSNCSTMELVATNFCPDCGADMREPNK